MQTAQDSESLTFWAGFGQMETVENVVVFRTAPSCILSYSFLDLLVVLKLVSILYLF